MMELDNILYEYEKSRTLRSITIELVNQCNWNCLHCYLDNRKAKIEKDTVYRLIDEARRLGAINIRFSGGEVMTYRDLAKVIEYSRKKYMNVILLSNASNLSEEVVECIKNYGINTIETTLFSTHDEIHDRFVNSPGALKKSLANLHRLYDMGVEVIVKTWAVNSNFEELEEMREYFTGLGYKFVVGVQIYSDLSGKMKLPENERLSNSNYCYALYLQDLTTKRELPLENCLTNRLCPEFMVSLYITADGDIVPCAKYRKAISNIYEDSLENVWMNSETLRKVQDYCWEDCKGCNDCDKRPYCVRCGGMSFIKGFDYLHNIKETCLLAEIRKNGYRIEESKEVY